MARISAGMGTTGLVAKNHEIQQLWLNAGTQRAMLERKELTKDACRLSSVIRNKINFS